MKKDIRNYDYPQLIDILESLGEKRFRATQIYEWLWKKGAESFFQMQNISKPLAEKLNQYFIIDKIKPILKVTSKDKTSKFLFETIDSYKFEGVLIPSKDRVTACISTQIGCKLKCGFCATGKLGFTRNLTTGEIFDQVFILNQLSVEIFKQKLSNIVVMGMGEPLLNYDNTLRAINIICSDKGMGISPQRLTLSTAGIAPQIKKLADDNIKFNLSISLHSASDSKRREIMPVNNKYNLFELQNSLKYFYNKTGSRVTYEYLILNGINDSIEDAIALSEFTKTSPCKINIIEYNSTENDRYKSTDRNKMNEFVKFLESKNLIVTIRKSKGQDINAACGQLANKNNYLNI